MEPFEQPGRLQGTIWTAREATGKHVDSPARARYLYGQLRRLQGRQPEAFGQPGGVGDPLDSPEAPGDRLQRMNRE